MMAGFETLRIPAVKQLENQGGRKERERKTNNFLGNGQMTGKDGDPWKKGNRQGKA